MTPSSPAKVQPERVKNMASVLSNSLSAVKSKYSNLKTIALCTGAFLSFFDLICDIVMVRQFILNKQTGAANATIAMLVLSLLIQLLLVFAQNMKQKKRIITFSYA